MCSPASWKDLFLGDGVLCFDCSNEDKPYDGTSTMTMPHYFFCDNGTSQDFSLTDEIEVTLPATHEKEEGWPQKDGGQQKKLLRSPLSICSKINKLNGSPNGSPVRAKVSDEIIEGCAGNIDYIPGNSRQHTRYSILPDAETIPKKYSQDGQRKRRPLRSRSVRQVEVPQGPFGLVLDDKCTRNGPAIYQVDDDEPLKYILKKGDVIVAVNGIDTRSMSSPSLAALLVKMSNQARTLTLLSAVVANDNNSTRTRKNICFTPFTPLNRSCTTGAF